MFARTHIICHMQLPHVVAFIESVVLLALYCSQAGSCVAESLHSTVQ